MSKWSKVRFVCCGLLIAALLSLLTFLVTSALGINRFTKEPESTPAKEVVATEELVSMFPTVVVVAPTTQSVEVPDSTAEWYYYLSPEDQDLIERVVMAESGNQSLLGQQAVAQCILNQAQLTETTPHAVVTKPHQYTAPYSGEVSLQTKEAVYLVFHDGKMAVGDNIQYFYSLATGNTSSWHESKIWVCTIGAHKFFKEE